MLWGQHYYFGMAYVYVIALLWIVEKLLAAYRAKTVSYKNYLALGIMMFLIFMFSPYFGYMILLFAVVYTIFRMFYKGYDETLEESRAGKRTQIRWGEFFRELFPMMITVVLGILCAMVLMLPYADMVLNTSTRVKGSYVYGTVESKEGGVLFLSIPYSNYWNIYVAGVRQEKVNADYGFMAVALEPGEHKVEAHYENVLYRYGAIGSLVSVVLFAGWIYLTKRHFHF